MVPSKQRSGGDARPLESWSRAWFVGETRPSMTRLEPGTNTRTSSGHANPRMDGDAPLASGVSEQVRRSREGRSREGGLGASSPLRSVHVDPVPPTPQGCRGGRGPVASPGTDTSSGPTSPLPGLPQGGPSERASVPWACQPPPGLRVGGVQPARLSPAQAWVGRSPAGKSRPTCAAPLSRPRAVRPSPVASHADEHGTHARPARPPRGSWRSAAPGCGLGRAPVSTQGRRM